MTMLTRILFRVALSAAGAVLAAGVYTEIHRVPGQP